LLRVQVVQRRQQVFFNPLVVLDMHVEVMDEVRPLLLFGIVLDGLDLHLLQRPFLLIPAHEFCNHNVALLVPTFPDFSVVGGRHGAAALWYAVVLSAARRRVQKSELSN